MLDKAWTQDRESSKDEAVLGRLIQLLADQSVGVSSFELWASGLVQALTAYLTSEGAANTAKPCLARLETFCKLFFLQDAGEIEPAVGVLVDCLMGALNTVEDFRVQLSSDGRASARGALGAPIRLRLELDPDCKSLKDFPGQMVLIEPLASVQAIEDFLWPRVRRSRATRQGGESGGAGDGDGDGDDGEPDEPDEPEQSRESRRSTEVIELNLPAPDQAAAAGAADAGLFGPVRLPGLAAPSSSKRLVMVLDGRDLPSNITIYQAIQTFGNSASTKALQSAAPRGMPFDFAMRASSGSVITLR